MNVEQLTPDPNISNTVNVQPRRSLPKKIATLVVVIILLVAFVLMVYALTTKRNPLQDIFPKSAEPEILTSNYCSSLPETEVMQGFGDFTFPRDYCFTRLAKQEGDYEYCNQDEGGSRNTCLIGVAAKLEDTAFCESLEPLYRNSCYSEIAQEWKDTKYCKELDLASKRDGCIMVVANVLEDINVCEAMEDRSLNGQYVGCISFQALRFNECSILQKAPYDIEDEVIKNAYDECIDRKRIEDMSKSLN